MAQVNVVSAPSWVGGRNPDVKHGPGWMIQAGLFGDLQRAGSQPVQMPPLSLPETPDEEAYLPRSGPVNREAAVLEACRTVRRAAEEAFTAAGPDGRCLFLGGDHSLSMGTVGAAAVAAEGALGVLWVDAHADSNTPESSPSGNAHGMALASLLGHGPSGLVDVGRPGISPGQVVLIGCRALDPPEAEHLRAWGVHIVDAREVDQRGMDAVCGDVLARLTGFERLHISLDMDVFDPIYAPGLSVPEADGLAPAQVEQLFSALRQTGRVRSMDVIEISPARDTDAVTARLAARMAAALLSEPPA